MYALTLLQLTGTSRKIVSSAIWNFYFREKRLIDRHDTYAFLIGSPTPTAAVRASPCTEHMWRAEPALELMLDLTLSQSPQNWQCSIRYVSNTTNYPHVDRSIYLGRENQTVLSRTMPTVYLSKRGWRISINRKYSNDLKNPLLLREHPNLYSSERP